MTEYVYVLLHDAPDPETHSPITELIDVYRTSTAARDAAKNLAEEAMNCYDESAKVAPHDTDCLIVDGDETIEAWYVIQTKLLD